MAAHTLALVGNPNTGKSSLFNVLTGMNQKVGNFPGVTVERKVGTASIGGQQVRIIDLPGSYGLYPNSEDERITHRILRNSNDPDRPQTVVVVADATNLKPSLLLTTQVMDLGYPTVLALNMADQLVRKDIALDAEKLQYLLGIPVVKISALKGWGIDALKQLLSKHMATPPRFFTIPEGFGSTVQLVRGQYGLASDYAAYQYLLAAEQPDAQLLQWRAEAGINNPQALIANEILVRYDRITDLLASEPRPATQRSRSARLDKVLLHQVWGYVLLLLVLLTIFQAIFTWASYPMDGIDAGMAALGQWLGTQLPEGFWRSLLVGGLLAGIQGVVVFIPQIALLFFFIALLEESGYMSRAMFLMDRLMRPFGLSGKSVIPLFGGFACAVPSIMGARSIPHPRERLITILITPLMSCSARIPVYTVLIAVFIPAVQLWGVLDMRALVMAAFYALGVVVALLVALLLRRGLPGTDNTFFLTELPNFRMPRWKNVGLDIYNKTRAFVFEAGRIILFISLILWVVTAYGPDQARTQVHQQYHTQLAQPYLSDSARTELQTQYNAALLQSSYAGVVGQFFEPLIQPLGYDWKIGIALISSFAAREVFVATMNTLYSINETGDDEGHRRLTERLRAERNAETGQMVYTTATVLSLLVFYALAMQCMSTLAIVRRETGGWKWALVMLTYQSGLAYILALVTYQLFR